MRLTEILAASVVLLLSGFGLAAQNRTVSGRVLDAEGLPVLGAGVVLEGTATGTVTDADGAFNLQVPAREVVLVVSRQLSTSLSRRTTSPSRRPWSWAMVPRRK